MPSYRNAPAVMEIGEELVRKYHTHLIGTEIRWIFRDEAAKKGGKLVYGTARLVQGLQAFLSSNLDSSDEVDPYFVIEIAEDAWDTLDEHEREALVDHELCHCGIKIKNGKDEDEEDIEIPVPYTVVHDVEEFRVVVERHGLWSQDMKEFAKTTKRHLVK